MKLSALMREQKLKGVPPSVPDPLCLQDFQISLFGNSNSREVCKELEESLEREVLAVPCSLQDPSQGCLIMASLGGPLVGLRARDLCIRSNSRCKFLEKSSGSSLQVSYGPRDYVDAEFISVGPVLCV